MLMEQLHSIIIPCHRVIESNGGLGGFGHGLKVKKQLLDLENADLIDEFLKDVTPLFGLQWRPFQRRGIKRKVERE